MTIPAAGKRVRSRIASSFVVLGSVLASSSYSYKFDSSAHVIIVHVAVTAMLTAHGPFPPRLFGTLLVATLMPALPATAVHLSLGKILATRKLQLTPGMLKYAKQATKT